MAGKFSIYKYVKLAGKGWRYARAEYHPKGKIKPDIVLVKGVNGKDVEEKHPEGSYVPNLNNKWIPAGEDALEAQHQRKLKLNQAEYERLRGKTLASGQSVVQLGRKIIKDGVDAYLANLELAKRPYKTVGEKRRFLTSFLTIVPKKFVDEFRAGLFRPSLCSWQVESKAPPLKSIKDGAQLHILNLKWTCGSSITKCGAQTIPWTAKGRATLYDVVGSVKRHVECASCGQLVLVLTY